MELLKRFLIQFDDCSLLAKNKGKKSTLNCTGHKGRLWYVGMNADIGMGSRIKVIQAEAPKVQYGAYLPDLLHGKEVSTWGDSA